LRPRPRHGGQLRLLDVRFEHLQGSVEDRGRVAARDLAGEKRLYPAQPIMCFLTDREL
jgi:hypothetical protein